MQCKVIDPQIATIKYGLANNPTLNMEPSSDNAFNALNISITTSTERLSVDAFYLPHEK
jgi:hypothetical protein